jgi:hypothetical protein
MCLSGITHVFVEVQINLFLIQFTTGYKVKGKFIPLQAWTGPYGSRSLRIPEFPDNRQKKVVSLSALCIGLLYPLGDIRGTHLC